MATGTNAAVRTRHALVHTDTAEAHSPGAPRKADTAGGPAPPLQVFSEAVAAGTECLEVGARLHRGGRAAVAIGERLLTGAVRPPPVMFHIPLLDAAVAL